MSEILLVFLVFLITLGTAIAINIFFIKRPLKFLVKKANISAIRWSSQSKPVFGGIGFFVVFIGIIIILSFTSGVSLYSNPEYFTVLLVVILAFFMGLADDIMSTPPMFKFGVQFLCALVFIFNGFYIQLSSYEIINYLITVIWVLGIMNSINMLDNMDAVTTLTSFSVFAGIVMFYLMGIVDSSLFTIIVLTGTCGSLLGFLVFNWHPSKMYMGDNGSQLLGVLLAFAGITFFWNSTPVVEMDFAYRTKQFVTISLAFVVPITDTTTVTINRLLRRQSPFIGGKDHTTHHLFYRGLSTRWIGVILFAINSLGVFLAFYVLSLSNPITNSKILLFAVYPLAVFLSLFINTKISKPK